MLRHPALYTDYYELTMAQGYFLSGRAKEVACFDYFFRDLPFDGGYVIFAGLADLLEILRDYTFSADELDWLEGQGFRPEFLSWLENFELSLDIHSAREGEVVFPGEPLVRVTGPIIEAQILETILLNILNFESLIATKASRMKYAAGDRQVLDFGLRRAQGFGGLQASKAAAIGGVDSTSNVLASWRYGIPASGTMAHSWIQSFPDELSAFRAFALHYPDSCVLLVDTYNTLKSGVPNAIEVAREMEERGERLIGIRLDSGDLAYFARESRRMLDEAGLEYVKIAASNQLDERLIQSLITQEAPLDLFGVGTRLVTGHETPALDGVYKLSEANGEPRLKISENIGKITLPGRKKVLRYTDDRGHFYGDGIMLEDEEAPERIIHPFYPARHFETASFSPTELHHPVMKNGEICTPIPDTAESARYARGQLQKLIPEHKRFDNPHIYKVGLSKRLMELRDTLTQKDGKNHG